MACIYIDGRGDARTGVLNVYFGVYEANGIMLAFFSSSSLAIWVFIPFAGIFSFTSFTICEGMACCRFSCKGKLENKKPINNSLWE